MGPDRRAHVQHGETQVARVAPEELAPPFGRSAAKSSTEQAPRLPSQYSRADLSAM